MAEGQVRFEQVYTRHYQDIRRFAGRRLAESEIDDATAEVFVVAWRRLDELPADAGVLPWLYAVARRVLANEYRRARRARSLADYVREQGAGHVDADLAEFVADRLAAASAFDRLAEADREIVRLVAWENLNSSEVAVVLGCARTTAAMRINRARRRLLSALRAQQACGSVAERVAVSKQGGMK